MSVKEVAEGPKEAAEAAIRRSAVRGRLIAERASFVASDSAATAAAELTAALCAALSDLDPECIGLYCPLPSEFNAAGALAADAFFNETGRALPYARRTPRSMEFRRWDGAAPRVADECGIGTGEGAVVVPEVVVVPCVGFTAAGHRLGYGGGYYDRWLAAHPHVVAVGVAWSFAELSLAEFAARPHDIALALVVTERGVQS